MHLNKKFDVKSVEMFVFCNSLISRCKGIDDLIDSVVI